MQLSKSKYESIYDQTDKKNVEEYLRIIGADFNSYMLHNPSSILKRIKMHIPPPNNYCPLSNSCLIAMDLSLMQKKRSPLFNQESKRITKNFLKTIELGHVSDVVDGPLLYREINIDNYGLIECSCFRDTSSIEGYHQNIIRKFSSINSGPRLANFVLTKFRL